MLKIEQHFYTLLFVSFSIDNNLCCILVENSDAQINFINPATFYSNIFQYCNIYSNSFTCI